MTPAQLAVAAAIERAAQSDQSNMRGARTPFMGPGDHQCLVAESDVEIKGTGQIVVWLKSVVTASDREQRLPLKVAARYDLTSHARFEDTPSDADMFAAFLMAATGCPNDGRLSDGQSNPKSQLRELIRDIVETKSRENILRGFAYSASGRYAKKENPKYALASDGRKYEVTGRAADGSPILNRDKSQFVYLSFSCAEQSDEEVAAARTWLDEHFPAETRAAAPTPVAPPPAPPNGPVPFRLPGR
jgi:hypothetical protein